MIKKNLLLDKDKRNDLLKLLYCSFKHDNIIKLDFQKYCHFSAYITRVSGIYDKSIIRTIFQQLINRGVIEKQRILKVCYYRFNPYKKDLKPNCSGIISFD